MTALLLADANIVMYVNSFFQESGAYLSFLGLVCAAYLLWPPSCGKRTLAALALLTGSAVLLAGTKVAYAFSVLPALVPLLAGCTIMNPALRRWVAASTALLLVCSVGFIRFFSVTSGNERQVNCYQFVFTGCLVFMSEGEDRLFLSRVGLDPSLTTLRGKDVYDADSQLGSLKPSLGTNLQLRALSELVLHHKNAAMRLFGYGFERTGIYWNLFCPSRSGPPLSPERIRWAHWSAFR